jgi:hypothetical protein
MSIRTLITTIAVAAAFLAVPAVGSAMPISDPISVHATVQPPIPAPVSSEPVASADGGGTATSTVLLIAGLTLLAGAATGIGGTRVVQRRGRAAQA